LDAAGRKSSAWFKSFKEIEVFAYLKESSMALANSLKEASSSGYGMMGRENNPTETRVSRIQLPAVLCPSVGRSATSP